MNPSDRCQHCEHERVDHRAEGGRGWCEAGAGFIGCGCPGFAPLNTDRSPGRTFNVEGSIREAHADGCGLVRFTLEDGTSPPAPGTRVVLLDPEGTTLVADVEQLAGTIITAIPIVGLLR